MGDIPAVFSVQTSRRTDRRLLRDADTRYLTDLRLSIVFRSGTLAMLSVAGPVIWNANYARRGAKAAPLWEVLSGAQPVSAAQLRRQRIDANRRAIASVLRAARRGATPPEQSPEHLLEVSRAWEELGRVLRS
jgi:NAD-dependent oxidoreductase involved in siderophore biosynthesis